jgi:hypothetical protein
MTDDARPGPTICPRGRIRAAGPPPAKSRPRIRLEVALPPGVHSRATVEATRRGQTVAAWIVETVEVALIPGDCPHGGPPPAGPSSEATP